MKSEKKSIFLRETATLNVTFLVLPGASILCIASAIDPLRAANRISGETLYAWTVTSPDGKDTPTTSGLSVNVTGKFNANAPHEVLIIIGGFGTAPYAKGAFLSGLAKACRNARSVGGVEAGTWLLGHCGMLKDRAATTHFEDREDFYAAFPEANISSERYVIDESVFSCAGAAPTFDFMLHLIRARQGASLALNVAAVFAHEASNASATSPLEPRDQRLATAIRLMESHLDEPLSTQTIAKRLKVTTRTLEHLFKRQLSETPAHFYLGLRLAAARKMVTDTPLPMTEIAARTGFSSAAIFTRTFHKSYASAPSRLRNHKNGK